MLASVNRLKKSHEISRVFSRGQTGAKGQILIKARPNGFAHSRAVAIVSKKISKKATVRNRIRRRVLGVLDSIWATVSPGYDIVITVRGDISEQPTTEITGQLKTALQKTGLAKTK